MESRRNHLEWLGNFFGAVFMGAIKGLYFLIDQTWVMFFVALLFFMFRPPELKILPFDRIAFVLLILLVAIAGLSRRRLLLLKSPIMLPMVGLIIIAAISAIQAPYEPKTWSILASTFIVPYAMFFLAKTVFSDDRTIKHFMLFCVIVTGYLALTAIFLFLGARSLVFPKYILDANLLPEQIERACGPFLSAVPNGMAIIILGMVSFHWFLKKGFRGWIPWLFVIAIPFSILATMTRSVWLSFTVSTIFFVMSLRNRMMKRVVMILCTFCFLGAYAVVSSTHMSNILFERASNKQNIDFRQNLYPAAFEMFKERPFLGWGTNQLPSIIPHYLSDYRDDVSVHNTYLEILVEHGIIGLIFYAFIILYLFKIGAGIPRLTNENISDIVDHRFVIIWRIVLLVFLMNGMVASMNYQFINSLIFTIAGIISAAESRLHNLNKTA